jgi:dTMP kinase
MLIVLEGLDGAGKTTQISLIKEHFISKGKCVRYLHYPRFDAPIYGDLIAKFLRGDFGKLDSVHPTLVALLFAHDRNDSSSQLREWLNDGDVVLLDRYVYSNIAFQCAKISDIDKRLELRDWIFNLEYNIFKIPRPNFNLFLDVPLNFVQQRLNSLREGDDRLYLNGKSDIHESDLEFQSRVRDIYIQECENGDDLNRVNCYCEENNILLEPNMVLNRILSLLNK